MMTYQELKDQENQYVMHTYGRFSIALDHGKGAQLWDVEGKRYIDLTSGIGCPRLFADSTSAFEKGLLMCVLSVFFHIIIPDNLIII